MSNSPPSSTSNLLEILTKLGSAIVGLSAFAYIAGYIKAISMYKAIGGDWIVEFLTVQDVLRIGSYSLAMTGVVCISSAYIIYSKGWVKLKLLTFWVIGVALSYYVTSPRPGATEIWYSSHEVAGLISSTLFFTAGCLISFYLYTHFINEKISRGAVISIFIGGVISLYILPTYLGKAWGYRVLTESAELPKVSDEKNNCYLLGNVNSKYLIGCVSEAKINSLKMIEINKETSFSQ